MLPPVPNSEYIDKFPHNTELSQGNLNDKRHQENYAAEVKVYRALEGVKKNVVVLHGLDYYHGQYQLFVGRHSSKKKKTQDCKLKAKDREGECDFLVLGRNYFVIIEVKDMSAIVFGPNTDDNKEKRILTDTFTKSFDQGIRTRRLIEAIEEYMGASTDTQIFQFSAYPNFEKEFCNQFNLDDQQIRHLIFKEDFLDFHSWWDNNVTSLTHLGPEECCAPESEKVKKVKQVLLTLWCSDQNNTCHTEKSDLGRNIVEISSILQTAQITYRRPKHENPAIVEAPTVFRNFLDIQNLTCKQMQIFSNSSKFQWINGPAGSGKTKLIFGKIIELFTQHPLSRVLLIRRKTSDENIRRFLTVLKANNISISSIDANNLFTTLEFLSRSSAQLVILNIDIIKISQNIFSRGSEEENLAGTPLFRTLIYTLTEHHVFIDDLQSMLFVLIGRIDLCSGENMIVDNFISAVKVSSEGSGRIIWIASDLVQSELIFNHPTLEFIAQRIELNLRPEQRKTLSANLRNTKDIGDVLSFLRNEYYAEMPFHKNDPSTFSSCVVFPEQETGHFVHGTRVTVHILEERNEQIIYKMIQTEVGRLTSSSSLQLQDVAVLFGWTWGTKDNPPGELTKSLEKIVDKRGNEKEESTKVSVTVCDGLRSYSSEWPAVVAVYCYEVGVMSNKLGLMLPRLYVLISRARVHCSVILYPLHKSKRRLQNKRFHGFIERLEQVARVHRYGDEYTDTIV